MPYASSQATMPWMTTIQVSSSRQQARQQREAAQQFRKQKLTKAKTMRQRVQQRAATTMAVNSALQQHVSFWQELLQFPPQTGRHAPDSSQAAAM
jgi:DNA-directed RNA polymerase specialized sigma54-like protein